jgi:UDP-glucose 4-epimerase
LTTPSRILVTGATGFIGGHLIDGLAAAGHRIRAAARGPEPFSHPAIEGAVLGDLTRPALAKDMMYGVDAVVHAAGLAHASAAIPERTYAAVNTDATTRLAQAARSAGVKHFVLISSVRAQTGPFHQGPVSEDMPAEPTDAYGRSKLEAERSVAEIFNRPGLRWTVLRPVLVYGPGVKGNMAALFRLARLPVPLPFAGLKSKRSLLSIGNLVHAVRHAIEKDAGGNAAYLVADPEPVAIADVIASLRAGLGKMPLLFPVPERAMSGGLRLAGRPDLAERLCSELIVDTRRLRQSGWTPPETTHDALMAAIRQTASQTTGRP